MLRLLFHIIAAIQFAFGCYYDFTYVRIPQNVIVSTASNFGGKLVYLTYLDALVQTLYFTVAVLNDLIGSNEATPSQKPLIRRIKDLLFSSLAFPLSMFVALSFWGIYAVDRELILPRKIDAYFPTWLNHLMHTNIAIFILIELVTTFRMYPTKKLGLSILSVFMLGYAVWIHIIYYNTGAWVYPVLAVINWPLRIFFYIASLGLASSLYSVGEKLNKYVWSKEVEQTVKSGKKKAK